ncbi:MAG TPA: OadG family protein [Oscillospiraceae bacterium]|nr:OadG family protein [Oscillospiraceae bacterium]
MFENYNWDTAFANFMDSLKVMGLGMGGIFLVLGVIFVSVVIMTKITELSGKKNTKSSLENDK